MVKNFQNSEFWTIKARVMEINLEKKVGFQKLRQDEIEFLQVQKRENSRIMIFVILTFCLTIIGKLTHHHQASTGPGRLGRRSCSLHKLWAITREIGYEP